MFNQRRETQSLFPFTGKDGTMGKTTNLNSDKSKVKPKTRPVVSGPVTVKKKSEFKKFTGNLSLATLKVYPPLLFGDVLIPAGKKAIEN